MRREWLRAAADVITEPGAEGSTERQIAGNLANGETSGWTRQQTSQENRQASRTKPTLRQMSCTISLTIFLSCAWMTVHSEAIARTTGPTVMPA